MKLRFSPNPREIFFLGGVFRSPDPPAIIVPEGRGYDRLLHVIHAYFTEVFYYRTSGDSSCTSDYYVFPILTLCHLTSLSILVPSPIIVSSIPPLSIEELEPTRTSSPGLKL